MREEDLVIETNPDSSAYGKLVHPEHFLGVGPDAPDIPTED